MGKSEISEVVIKRLNLRSSHTLRNVNNGARFSNKSLHIFRKNPARSDILKLASKRLKFVGPIYARFSHVYVVYVK